MTTTEEEKIRNNWILEKVNNDLLTLQKNSKRIATLTNNFLDQLTESDKEAIFIKRPKTSSVIKMAAINLFTVLHFSTKTKETISEELAPYFRIVESLEEIDL